MKVTKLESFPPCANPFVHDAYNMSTAIGNNVVVMYDKHPSEHASYLIVVNKETGERLRIDVDSPAEKENLATFEQGDCKPLRGVIEELATEIANEPPAPRFFVQADKSLTDKPPLKIIMNLSDAKDT